MRSSVAGRGAHRGRLPGGEPAADGLVDGQRARRHAGRPARAAACRPPSRGVVLLSGGGRLRWPSAMRRLPRPSSTGWAAMSLPSSRMLDLGRGDLDLDRPAAGAVGDGVEVAADRDHALARDAALEAEHGVERPGRQGLEGRLLLGEVLGDDPAGGAVQAAVGDLVEPLAELGVQVVEVAEAAGEEEVLAHVAERPLHLALGLGPVGPAGLGQEAVVARPVPGACRCRRCRARRPRRGRRSSSGRRGSAPARRRAPRRRRRGSAARWRGPAGRQSGPTSCGCGRARGRTARRPARRRARRRSSALKKAKSTCAWRPGGVSKRRSKAGRLGAGGRRAGTR